MSSGEEGSESSGRPDGGGSSAGRADDRARSNGMNGEHETPPDAVETIEPSEAELAASPAERQRFRRITAILAIVSALLLVMWWKTESGDFTFLLQPPSQDQDEISFAHDGKRLVLYCLVIAVVALVLFVARVVRRGALFSVLVALVGIAFIVGFCAWAYSGQDTMKVCLSVLR